MKAPFTIVDVKMDQCPDRAIAVYLTVTVKDAEGVLYTFNTATMCHSFLRKIHEPEPE